MIKKRTVTDLDECRVLWNFLGPARHVSDLWEFRLCFHKYFQNQPFFLVLEDNRGLLGMLPLCRLAKEDTFVFFPGETWQGRTWIERTPIYCREQEVLPEILSACPPRTYLRYIEADETDPPPALENDEIGYLLHPLELQFDIQGYYERFNRKKFKAIKKEIASILSAECSWHVNRLTDYDVMVRMNRGRFENESYFHDTRFTEGFRDVVLWLQDRGWLRMVSLEIGAETAAVDLGAVYNGSYVVFLGGTNPDFPGVAKAINMYHIESAFEQGFSRVDFLCGDFYWKKLWHLDPQPLYKFISPCLKSERQPKEGLRENMDFLVTQTGLSMSAY
jgi:hypothetical protein